MLKALSFKSLKWISATTIRYITITIIYIYNYNYKSTQRKFMSKEAVPKQALKQKRLHEHYCSDRYNGIQDWVIALIDSADTLKELRKKELYWMYKLKTYAPYGLNERDVYEAF